MTDSKKLCWEIKTSLIVLVMFTLQPVIRDSSFTSVMLSLYRPEFDSY